MEVQILYERSRHGEVPGRFIAGCKGNKEEAERRWAATFEWRKQENIDNLLDEPQHKFVEIKKNYPQFVHGRAKNGHYVYYERPGLADFNILTQIADVDELLMYYVYTTEWIWRVLDEREEGRLVSVWDLTGASASSLVGDRMKMLRRTMGVISEHYPERSDKLFIINAPFWFSATWRVISPWIDPNTRNKISILGGNYASALRDYIGEENVPRMFGGSDPRELGDSDEETKLRQFVDMKMRHHEAIERLSESESVDTDLEGYETVSDGEGDDKYESPLKQTVVVKDSQASRVSVSGGGYSREGDSVSGGGGSEGRVAIHVLDELMLTVEELSKQLDTQRKEIELLEKERDKCKLQLFEVVGRKSGLQNQMTALCSDEHITAIPASSSSSSSWSRSRQDSATVSLTLTMQLKRIRHEAERLCERGNAAQTLLSEADAGVKAAELIADGLMDQKRAASRRLSELLAQAVTIGVF